MPWEPQDAIKHTKAAKSAVSKRAFADAANSILQATGDEGRAIRGGNAAVNKSNAKGEKKVADKNDHWMEDAEKRMEEKGTKGSFGKATSKKIAAGIKKGGKQKKKALFAGVAKKIANKRKAIKRG